MSWLDASVLVAMAWVAMSAGGASWCCHFGSWPSFWREISVRCTVLRKGGKVDEKKAREIEIMRVRVRMRDRDTGGTKD